MVFDGLRRDVEACRDLGVGQPLDQQLQDLALARGQLGGVVGR